MADEFHSKPYDAATLAKLRIFELYTQEWIPVFLSREKPPFPGGIHIFDFFCGPGTDSEGTHGSPLRILSQLRGYSEKPLAGWGKVPIVAHFHDEESNKIDRLGRVLTDQKWAIPDVRVDRRSLSFRDALAAHNAVLSDAKVAKLLIIDQFGVDEVSDVVFKQLAKLPTADFIFFLSSSTLHRFRNHPAIKQKIEKVEDSYEVHRAAVNYYRKLLDPESDLFLGSFSIRKRSNIYGLIFGSHHPLGIHKFLQVAWAADEIVGEANFDIDRENIRAGEGLLPLEEFRPTKIREFEHNLETELRARKMNSEADVIRFCVEAGMTCRHSEPVLKKLKKLKNEKIIDLDFRVPDVKRLKAPRPIDTRSDFAFGRD
jgi:three-Cys-motif partner protein